MEDAKNISKTYDPKEFEERIYKWWLDSGFFTPKVDKKKKHYTIIMPPPNITGKLHMGHALNVTIQDVLIRFKRMQGYSTLYLPGEDHASIATEVKVEKELLKKGIKKRDIGREEFLKKVWEWTDEYRNKIRTQVQKMGCSADFTRERFTMDENVSKAVRAVFVKLFNEGLIYQGNRLINWCPKCMTALSDAEIEYEEKPGNFYHVKYPIYGEEGKFIEVATTRPETMFGDAAVAVNPKDERYKDIVGKTLILPLTDRKIPVISDYYVDMEFGTGIVKITPAHDPNDYEVGKRHDLPEINILNGNGTLNENCGKYQGMDRYDARKKVVEDLKKLGLLVKVEERTHNVGCHDRCGTVVEPIISKQWFVKMDTLAKPALKVVREGKVKFIPERFEKIYDHWLSNIRDWCISRQLWWGHRIPVWYCDDCGAIMASETDLKECSKCGSKNIRQDEDVLDTWFSSALWPFSTLGWPDKTEDLKYFYPTNTLVTAADIIPFWVVRMVFSSLHNMGEIPFDTVYINSLVRDSLGRKMSKSLGNGIDPLDVINKYGTDALRHMLVTGNAPGNDIRFREEKIESSRNFANKIWNASRFVMMNLDEEIMNKYKDCNDYSLADKWIVSRLNTTVKEVTENLDKFEIGIASTKIYDFIWTEFCDYYIEFAKVSIYGDDEKAKGVTLNVLKHVLSESLKLLHPIMPFITEEIYTHLDNEYKSISVSKWPEYEDSLHNEKAEKEVSYIIEAIKGIRNARLSMNVPFSRKAKMLVFVTEQDCRKAYESGTSYFEKMASVSSVEYIDKKSEDKNNVSVVTKGAEIYIPLTDLIDIDKEIERLKKEEEKLQGEIKRCTGKLSNEKFTSKAPEAIVNAEREKLKKYQEMYDSVASRIKGLKK